MENSPDLFHCEPFNADIMARQCLVNQARGELEGDLSIYFKCLACDVGKLLREANGGELPEVKMTSSWTPTVVGSKLSAQARRLRREKKKEQSAASNQQSVKKNKGKAMQPGAQIKKKEPAARPACHIKRRGFRGYSVVMNGQAVKANGVDILFATADQAHDFAEKIMAGEMTIVSEGLAAAGAEPLYPDLEFVPAEKAEKDPPEKLCCTCGEDCLTAMVRDPKHAEKGVYNAGEATRQAHEALKRLKAGGLVERDMVFELIFAEVPELKPLLEQRARFECRSLAAEIAVRLRQTFPELVAKAELIL